jgi:hypothetical protein
MKNKFQLLLYFSFLIFNSAFAQPPGEWMWIHGSNTINSIGSFGTQGVASAANEPPALYEPCEFTDANGNFWLYGGSNNSSSSIYADLWKYNPATSMWTWMKGPGTSGYAGSYGVKGVPSITNNPPAKSYGVGSWTDNQGNFWMFGAGSGSGNDLWKYDLSANEWTWMKGSNNGIGGVFGTMGVPDTANFPDGRYECVATWIDISGDLWMFGGILSDRNDLWRYNISTNTWTWMKGDMLAGAPAVYGTIGVEDPLNTPGASCVYSRWRDQAGNLWMWGGESFLASKDLNEMWRYNPITNNWAWMGGNPAGNTNPVYGTQCITDSLNDPGGRFENRACWKDAAGNFYIFGGGIDALSSVRNDLWKYCIATGEWTWLSGSQNLNPSGNWGTQGVPSVSNIPGGRGGAIGWSDQNGHIYLFGGSSGGYNNPFNDLWIYTIDNTCGSCNALPVAAFTSVHPICPGTCTDFTNNSINGTTYQWFFPGAVPSVSVDVAPVNICYATPGNYDVTLIATNASGSDTLTLANYMSVYPYPAPQGISQSGDTLFANPGAVSYQWYLNGVIINGATDYFYLALVSGDYNVVATDANDCEVEAVIFDVLADIPFFSDPMNDGIRAYPNPVTDMLSVIGLTDEASAKEGYRLNGAVKEILVYNILGENLSLDVDLESMTINCQPLSAGIYYFDLVTGEKSFRCKFVKE